jgi:hypothetical protein
MAQERIYIIVGQLFFGSRAVCGYESWLDFDWRIGDAECVITGSDRQWVDGQPDIAPIAGNRPCGDERMKGTEIGSEIGLRISRTERNGFVITAEESSE